MISDAQVKEIALLKEYAKRLDGFKDAILAGCGILQNKAESIMSDMQNTSSQVEQELQQSQQTASRIISKYENDIIERYHLTSSSSIYLGTTASDAESKLAEINQCGEEIKDRIGHINSLISALQGRTATYAIAIRSMSEKASEQLTKRYDILEKYKEQNL